MNISMILSGGSGSRFGGEMPKQYNMLCGKEVIAYSVEALKSSERNDKTVIICDEVYIDTLSEKYGVTCIKGGNSRNASLRLGLEYIKSNYPECVNVFITEAARPFLTADIADLYFENLSEYDAVITAKHITDSLGKYGEAVTLRDKYYLVQAPEAFDFNMLYEHFSPDSPITATVQQLPESRKVMNYFDFRNNMKITYPEDLLLAERLMEYLNGEIRVGKE